MADIQMLNWTIWKGVDEHEKVDKSIFYAAYV